MAIENLKTLPFNYMMNYRNIAPRADRWEERIIEVQFDFAEEKMPCNGYHNKYYTIPIYRVEVPFKYHYLPKDCPLPFNKDNIEQFKSECQANEIGSMRLVNAFDSYMNSVALFFIDGEKALECYKKVCAKMEEWALTTYESHKKWLDKQQKDAESIQVMKVIANKQLNSLRERLAMI